MQHQATGPQVRYRAEVEAALTENRDRRYDRIARTGASRAIALAVNELFERYLTDPASVEPGEVLALELATRTAGRWCERIDGVDRWADVRAARIALLRKIRECCGPETSPNSGPSHARPTEILRHDGIPLSWQADGQRRECPDVNRATTDFNWAGRIASNIRHARKTAGLTQQRLAEEIGAVRTQVVDWESGRRGMPGIANLDRIAEATGRNVGWFYDEHDLGDDIEP